uniref:Replication protein A 32 kDa subunit n=1 Tax=Cacopsylla melanoneura TaxID=428564 RepID=A0A8D9ECX7_9HEMI
MWNSDENNYDGGGGFDQSSTSEKKGGKQNEQKTIFPVTVRQILETPHERVKVNDMEVHLATIMGIVKSVDISSIKVNYLVQDNTGILSCVHWIDAEDHGYKPLKENTFVKIVGHIKSLQDGKKNLMIYSAQYVEDFNEVTSHMLEVVLIPLKAEKMKTVTQGDNYAKMQLQSNYGNDSSMNNSSVGVTGASGDAAKIMQVIRSFKNDNYGVDINTIVSNLAIKMPLQQVKNIVEELINEGHIYTTIDDNHFQTVD